MRMASILALVAAVFAVCVPGASAKCSGEPHGARTCATLYFGDNRDGFELFREVTLGSDDCEGWHGLNSSK